MKTELEEQSITMYWDSLNHDRLLSRDSLSSRGSLTLNQLPNIRVLWLLSSKSTR